MRTSRPAAARSALTLLLATLLLAGCNGLIDQQATYTTSATQSITGTAATRNGDPLTGVTVNGVGATLNGQKYSVVLGARRHRSVQPGARRGVVPVGLHVHRAGHRRLCRRHLRDGGPPAHQHVTGGGGVRLTAAGFAKLLPDTASSLVLPTALLTFPTLSLCSGTCTVSQAAPPTIGDFAHHVSLTLTSPSALSVQATLPLVEEYLSFHSGGTSCSFTITYSQIEDYENYQVAAGPTEAGGVARVRHSGSGGPVLLFKQVRHRLREKRSRRA